MMNKFEEIRQARHDLEMLSASHPAVSANMLRYVAAYSLMITGRRGRERRKGEPQIGAGFLLTDGNEKLIAAAARRSGTDYIYIAFDVDDGAGPALAAGVFRQQGDDMFVCGHCRLWSPTCATRPGPPRRGQSHPPMKMSSPGLVVRQKIYNISQIESFG